MNFILRIFLVITLFICYKYIPVFEPIGINYIISILCLGSIGFELNKLWNSIKISEIRKNKIQKIGYLSLISLVLTCVILLIHKDLPAENIRFLRGALILTTITIVGKIIGIITKSSVNTLVKNIVLIVFSTFSFISIIEIIFMFISLSHGGGEAYSGKIWGNRYWNPINKLGFRDEEPKKGKNTVFFVGDSFTAGWGVKKIEDRFGEVTARELNKLGKPINEINLGRYGADTRLEYHIFETFIKKTQIKPKHVVLQFFVNDMDKFIPKSKKCEQKSISIPVWKKTIIDGSYLVNYINSIYPTNSGISIPKECEYPELLSKVFNNDSLWGSEVNHLNKFKNYCRKQKIKMTIIYFPFMEDLTLAKKIGIEKRISNYCKENNIQLLNVTNFIKSLSRKERQVSIMDSHASVKVHKLAGKNLVNLFIKNLND